jgi:acyl-CoA synthetase (AMP-forming)/AMP-acid ligase II
MARPSGNMHCSVNPLAMETVENNIIQLFIRSAASFPARAALIQDNKTISYGELLTTVKQHAGFYKSKGIGKEDKVLVFIPVSIDLYIIVLALFYLGATPVFLDEWVSVQRLSVCCKVVPCKAIIAGRKFLFLSYVLPGLRKISLKLSSTHRKSYDENSPQAVKKSGTALITFTTGSTGIPKAANRTHQFLWAQFAALKPLLVKQGECLLTTLPIVTLLNIGLAKTTVLPPKKFTINDAAKLADKISRSAGIDSIITSPWLMIALAKLKNINFDNIRHAITGGGSVLPTDAKLISRNFEHADVTIVYGSTEAEPIAHINAREIQAVSTNILMKMGLPVGKPDGIQLKIIAISDGPVNLEALNDWSNVELPSFEAGEIIVSGPHVLREYVNNPVAVSRNKIKDGEVTWHRTGDVGRLDDTGKIYFLGRCNEIITWNGKQFFPVIIAAILNIEAAAGDTALLQYKGEPCVVFEKADRPKLNEILRVLDDLSLNGVAIRFIKKIPKDPRHHTKTDYDALRKLL